MPSMNSAFRDIVHGFLKSRSVSHSVDLRVQKGDTPASSSSQFSIGVTSAARFGANVAAPPLKFQLVAAPSSTMAMGSLSSPASRGWPEDALDEVCPWADRHKDRDKQHPASVNKYRGIDLSPW